MGQIELRLPKMGESVAEATITKWLKQEGDKIEADESVVEIATDKVDSEVPATDAGILSKKLFNEGDVVKVGDVFAIIETSVSSKGTETPAPSITDSKTSIHTAPAPALTSVPSKVSAPVIASTQTSYGGNGKIQRIGESGRFYSPLVRKIAQTEGLSMGELETITGTGNEGRVTKQDLMAYLPGRSSSTATIAAPIAAEPVTARKTIVPPSISVSGEDEIIEMDRMRKLIADHMVMSKHVSPHVTSYVEADVTNMVNWRNKVKGEFQKREGENLTFTPIFIEAVVQAIKEMPMVNVSVNGSNIIKRGSINIGMATALPNGNLIVPVIKHADRYNLMGLTKTVNDLANRARNNQLKPEDIQGGTYTVTNVGTFGNVMGTPIINQPQAAILALGAIRKKPAVLETEYGDVIAIRYMMFLSHSYDHRVIDGALGGRFVRRVADILEGFDKSRQV